MNLVRRSRVRGLFAAALLGVSAGGSYAADATPAPAPAAPAAAMPACESCAAAGGQTCDAGCKKSLLGGLHHTKKLHAPFLCPGACFGYFQTKWNRWEDVCSHYYQGVNVSDAPKAPIPAAQQPPVFPKAGAGTNPMPTPMPVPEAKSPLPAPTAVPPTVAPPTVAPTVVPPKGNLNVPPPSVVPPTAPGPKNSDLPPLPTAPPSKFSP